jgi:hypothetical protein
MRRVRQPRGRLILRASPACAAPLDRVLKGPHSPVR